MQITHPRWLSERSQRVLAAVGADATGVSIPELTAMLGIERHILSTTLSRLTKYGLIERAGHGVYRQVTASVQIAQPCVCRCCDH